MGVQRDWLYVRMAKQLLEKHQPNLLLLHIIEVDHVQHQYGPRSDEAYWSLSYADDRLRELVEAIERSPRAKETTLFVCSDHGFFPIEKEIRPNVTLRQLGLLTLEGKVAANKRALCLSQGGGCAVYVFDDANRATIIKQLADQLGHLEGVVEVILPEQFDRIGQPTRVQDPRGADFWLSAKSGYSFTDSIDGDLPVVPRSSRAGTHGYLPEQAELLGTCIIWGAGVSAGTKLGTIRNLDIAPTMAKRLGVDIPGATGRTLTEVAK
jgi:arylsulfatase A-like enzyme